MTATRIDVPRRTRPAVATVLGVVAAGGGVAAAAGMWQAPAPSVVAAALGLHVLAALAARFAAQLGGAEPCELDLVTVLAVAAPVFGPGCAWLIAFRGDKRRARNAHAAFEARMPDTVAAASPELERELQVVSHAHVLQHGSLEEKRNLLRQLARIGERRYLLLLRRFLLDGEPELQLCAYAELARVCHERELRIRELRKYAEDVDPAHVSEIAAARAELAEANRDYATSGLLDDDMAKYWLDQARSLAESALAEEPECLAAQRVLVLALADLGAFERAWAIASDWPEDVGPAHDLARAELAYRRRDRATCNDVAARLRRRGVELPPWLAAVVGEAAGATAEER